MASRPELIQCCEILNINTENMSIDEMTKEIRLKSDELFDHKHLVSGDKIPEVLRKFLSQEYNYIFRNKKGKQVDYKGRKI